ncbi:tetratricopeptide repeat-containing sensor histidine kinase [Marivirga sp.]|uniref:tetratricopeptide repeat-containing sensor histidine kinase n=1 Tax=Marivirga sp. TaxID=2018662 RepID=UPI002D7F475D|nr:tetratricopeptide repeat-containing sensor histidine kinase [Marivirga sp.]HET8859328.1 tetratricopeptide repeat-containing sensor histidine kinase [Marivirga sp.]
MILIFDVFCFKPKHKLSIEVIKTILLSIFLLYSTAFIGISQNISLDSLNKYYQYELKGLNNSSENVESLTQQVDNIQISSISDFSELQPYLKFTALIEGNKEYDLGVQLTSKIIPQTKSIPEYQAFFYLKLAQFYIKLDKTVASLESYLKASSLLEKANEYSYLAYTYYRIGRINMNGWNNTISIEYANKGLNTLNKIENYSKLDSLSLLGLYEINGVAYRRNHEFDESLKNINQALILASALKDSVRLALNNGNKATIYYEKGDYELAIPLLQKDFETSIKSGVYNSGLNALIYLSWIYLEMDNLDSLNKTFEKMQKVVDKYPITDPRSRAEYLKVGAKVAELKGDTSKANQYLKNYIAQDKIRDSINLSNDVSSLHEQHLMEQEISKLELLQNANELQASHLKLRTSMLIIIAIALLVVLWYVFTLRNKNKKIDRLNELLEAKVSERTARLMEINKELDTYLYRASHDIRRPIRTLLGLNNIAQINTDPEQMRELFTKVHITAMSMDKMLFKLQMAYELNNSHGIEKVNIEELTKECIDDMSLEIKEHHSKVTVKINENAKIVQANKALLRIALDNIIENALLYQSSEDNEIEIFTDEGNYFFYIHVKDNGFGIPEKYYNDLFKPYFKLSNKTQGSGLGLFLAHKAISFLAGELTVTSTINEGSQFTIKIPINPK